ncbi:hypothetical protein MMC13_000559 [Lambiella insularis]|nr:hypothetical protein [Lambiella insularis]
MVKIAIAGGSGNVALEVIDALVATEKHEILLLSRKDVPDQDGRRGVTWAKTSYQDPKELRGILGGVHTVLSFIVTQSDPGNISQKNLIDAAIQTGVKRFAPSEWATSNFEHLPWYTGKAEVREYLRELNQSKKVLEYSLFLPGLFTNYFTYPYESAKHFHPFETHIDFNKRRALTLDGGDDDRITLTTVQDLSNIVARAVEYKGEWPVVGGIRGTEISIGQLLALGERVRGEPFHIEKLKAKDLEAGVAKCSWLPTVDHPGIPHEQAEALAPMLVAGMLLGTSAGALRVTDEWNRLLPDYQFTQAEEFLAEAWHGKI